MLHGSPEQHQVGDGGRGVLPPGSVVLEVLRERLHHLTIPQLQVGAEQGAGGRGQGAGDKVGRGAGGRGQGAGGKVGRGAGGRGGGRYMYDTVRDMLTLSLTSPELAVFLRCPPLPHCPPPPHSPPVMSCQSSLPLGRQGADRISDLQHTHNTCCTARA